MTVKQFVVFGLGQEEYGVEIAVVQEILRPPKITRLPTSPPYVLGVVNLRGHVIPVIDLKNRLGMEHTRMNDETRVIIVKNDEHSYGVVVDSVCEVLSLQSDCVEQGKDLFAGVDGRFVTGVARLEERLIILLNLSAEVGALS